MKKITALPALMALTAAQPAAHSPIEGYWKNPIGSAIIAIRPCGEALCGKVVWASERGQHEVANNTAHVVGTTVLTGLKSNHERWSGSLFIPDDNIHVTAHLEMVNSRALKLTGCAIMGFICRTQIWTRVDEPLPGTG